jgi:hypothetical protein
MVLSSIVLLVTSCSLPNRSAISQVSSASTATAAPTVAQQEAAPAPVQGFATAIRDVAATVKPAVVQITNEQIQFDQYNQPFTVPAGVGSGVIYDL